MLRKTGTSHAVKSFATGSFLQCFVVKIANDCLFYETIYIDHFLVKFAEKISMKLPFFTNCFLVKLP